MASFLFMGGSGSGNNRGEHGLQNSSTASTGSSGDPNSSTAAECWTPVDYTLKHSTRIVTTAPGGVTDVNYRVKKNSTSPVNLSAILTIAGASTVVTTDIEATVPAIDGTSNATILTSMNFMTEWVTGAAAASNSYYAHEYEVGAEGRISFYSSGNGLSAWSSIPANPTFTYGYIGQSSVSGTVSFANACVPWPLGGNFKRYAIVWKSVNATTTFSFALVSRTLAGIAGADTVLFGPFTLAAASPISNWQALVDNSTLSGAVAEGDLVALRIQQATGAGTSLNLCTTFGFLSS